jgi:hypothetical protein
MLSVRYELNFYVLQEIPLKSNQCLAILDT